MSWPSSEGRERIERKTLRKRQERKEENVAQLTQTLAWRNGRVKEGLIEHFCLPGAGNLKSLKIKNHLPRAAQPLPVSTAASDAVPIQPHSLGKRLGRSHQPLLTVRRLEGPRMRVPAWPGHTTSHGVQREFEPGFWFCFVLFSFFISRSAIPSYQDKGRIRSFIHSLST